MVGLAGDGIVVGDEVSIHGNKLIKEYYNSLKAGDIIMVETPNEPYKS